MSGLPVQKGVLQCSPNYTWNCADALGRGATAVVYLGRHKGTGQVVAVKVFHQHLRHSYCKEDLPELEILRRLNHDNVIRVLGIENELQSKRSVLVMEYCEGGSVLSMLDQPQYHYGLPEAHFLLVLYHVAAGMQYLRQVGVVHRDIKPANIMRSITEDGSSVYKLTDFGAARELSDDENFTSLYGTEEYLHPEMYEKGVLRLPTEQRFDARVDLWSLGVTFYHVATGQLPFQPHGGRSNKGTMYHIISQKESGVISGQQHFEGAPIQWSRDLPDTCLLSSGVRQFLTPLLAGLLEASQSQMLSYEELFRRVQRLKASVTLHVFDCLHAAQHTLLMDPSATLSDIQAAITSLTKLPASQQLLLGGGGHEVGEVVGPQTPITSFPTQLKDSTLFLFPWELAESLPPALRPPYIPAFPEFLNVVDVSKDSSLALTCVGRGHLVQHHTDRLAQQQQCLLQAHLHLRMHVESGLRRVGEALHLIRRLVKESRKRFTTFFSSVRSTQTLLTCLGHPPDKYLQDVLKDDTLLQVQKKTEERVEEIVQYKQAVVDKVKDTRSHTLEGSTLCHHSACSSKVGHQLSLMGQIQARFRRDKSVKDSMTPHDENIHRLQRHKLQETCSRMVSFLTGHCVPVRDQLHKQAWENTGSLMKALARIVKVAKNNDSVLNCQQLLSARLDKLEAKCQDEVQHLQTQLMLKLTREPQHHPHHQHHQYHHQQHCCSDQGEKLKQQHLSNGQDEGLGTSVLGSRSGSGSRSEGRSLAVQPCVCPSETETAVTRDSAVGSLDSAAVQHSLQSLRLESEEVLCLLVDNLHIMKRMEMESMQADISNASLSRLSQDTTPT